MPKDDITPPQPMITRFAPSPTGLLHLGHLFSAWVAQYLADDGHYHVRIEDIDQTRARPEFYTAIEHDLKLLHLDSGKPYRIQSQHHFLQQWGLEQLKKLGLLYPCFCSRKDILSAVQAPQEGDPAQSVYPGTCRHLHASQVEDLRAAGKTPAWRLDINKAMMTYEHLDFYEWGTPTVGPSGHIQISRTTMVRTLGDVILARKDIGISYHLAVILCDAAQNISLVSRGQDLFLTTPIQVLLQKLLQLPTPHYFHHALVRDQNAQRLAKRHQAQALQDIIAKQQSTTDIWRPITALMEKTKPMMDRVKAL